MLNNYVFALDFVVTLYHFCIQIENSVFAKCPISQNCRKCTCHLEVYSSLYINMAMKAKLSELLDEECSIIMSTVIYQRLSRGQDCLLQSTTPSVWTAYP